MKSNEILEVVDSVSTEKGLDKDLIFKAIEIAIASASQRHFHEDADLFVKVNRQTGEYSTHRNWLVFDKDDEEFHHETHISSDDSKLNIGEIFSSEQENITFGRIETQAARQVMLQKVREAEREKVVEQFKSQNNKLVSGSVKRVTRDNIIVDITHEAEALLPRDKLMPGEIYKINDRIRAVLQIIEIEGRGPQLMLNRSCPEMVTELFSIEVPEINEDIIEIRGVARDAGSRSKIAVKTNDGRIDPVGACVGMRGSRVQAVSSELGNERIDIIIYDDNPAQLVINALSPAKVESIVMDEDSRSMDIAVNEDNLALAIGSRGQNIRLASKLVGWNLNIISNEEAEAKVKVDETEFLAKIIDSLEIKEEIAEQIISSGFTSFDDIAYADDKLFKDFIETEDEINKIKSAAEDAALLEAMGAVTEEEDNVESLTDLNLEEENIQKLSNKGIKNKDDLAELSIDELKEIIDISDDDASKMIMKAREHWFK
ncbi:MAG: transcription termination/antitermination protein NusA [SAR86 cluster bacterium]|jgi:N utilization substance protein A|uniref:Transcription termination/antitermination protein NusA n=1 Tax=SAR86 cluster bacterium TaxID=2030880 RepID=A0A520N212_9GAMM|nr:MAG: transcription termination/antitermination protein NusA [Gammaproteobacteria bacterium TMED225]RZO27466.1 MAG: transcription termination/antitermination protein NusA [SAR86 cluster bacterium]|tara:strand:+ start:3188 stop:4648 length:1461 start_codon:yes stop_codon:yes gene_type:complete